MESSIFDIWVEKISLPTHYENKPIQIHCILKILQPKKDGFQMKNSDIFHISAQNIDCGYSLELPWQGNSNEYPQSMFFSKIRKTRNPRKAMSHLWGLSHTSSYLY